MSAAVKPGLELLFKMLAANLWKLNKKQASWYLLDHLAGSHAVSSLWMLGQAEHRSLNFCKLETHKHCLQMSACPWNLYLLNVLFLTVTVFSNNDVNKGTGGVAHRVNIMHFHKTFKLGVWLMCIGVHIASSPVSTIFFLLSLVFFSCHSLCLFPDFSLSFYLCYTELWVKHVFSSVTQPMPSPESTFLLCEYYKQTSTHTEIQT